MSSSLVLQVSQTHLVNKGEYSFFRESISTFQPIVLRQVISKQLAVLSLIHQPCTHGAGLGSSIGDSLYLYCIGSGSRQGTLGPIIFLCASVSISTVTVKTGGGSGRSRTKPPFFHVPCAKPSTTSHNGAVLTEDRYDILSFSSSTLSSDCKAAVWVLSQTVWKWFDFPHFLQTCPCAGHCLRPFG